MSRLEEADPQTRRNLLYAYLASPMSANAVERDKLIEEVFALIQNPNLKSIMELETPEERFKASKRCVVDFLLFQDQ